MRPSIILFQFKEAPASAFISVDAGGRDDSVCVCVCVTGAFEGPHVFLYLNDGNEMKYKLFIEEKTNYFI